MIVKDLQIFIYVFCLIPLLNSIANPGLLLQVPDKMTLPIININLPISIPPIVASNLELNQIFLREVNYSWKIQGSKFIVSIPSWLVQFQWFYKNDKGRGTFTETYLQLTVDWQPAVDSNHKFYIKINSVSLKDGDLRSKIKVHLGGGVSETVLVEVTDIIMNHGRVIFKQALTNALTSLIQTLSDPLKNDAKILCPETNDCIYFNTSLVADPYLYQNQILIQVNGASYSQKHPSHKELNPSPAIIKLPNSNSIIIQLHEQAISSIFKAYEDVQPLSLSIKSTEISSITQINSQTLSMVFPKLRTQLTPIPVIFKLLISNITAQSLFKEQLLGINAQMQAQILLQRPNGTQEQYIKSIKGEIQGKIKLVANDDKVSIRINKVELMNLKYDEGDIVAGLLVPQQFQKHIPTLMQWLSSGINGDINEKVQRLEFKQGKIRIIQSIFAEGVIGLEIVFEQTSKNEMQLVQL